MMRSLWTAASGMLAQQTNIDIISNNIANVNTAGFKKTRGDFQDLMYQNMRKAGTTTGQDANKIGSSIDYLLIYTKKRDDFITVIKTNYTN